LEDLNMQITKTNPITQVPAASSEEALRHFEARFTFETDCADVHAAFEADATDFVLVDARGEEAFSKGHVPGAVNIPQWRITEKRLQDYPKDLLFVTYCAGPHCNASQKAAIRLARLGRPVKEMLGGIEGWKDEGYELTR